MSIRFEPGKRPKYQDYLDQAAGVGVTFPEDSMEEFYFLQVCAAIWSAGYQSGLEKGQKIFLKVLRDSTKNDLPKYIRESRIEVGKGSSNGAFSGLERAVTRLEP